MESLKKPTQDHSMYKQQRLRSNPRDSQHYTKSWWVLRRKISGEGARVLPAMVGMTYPSVPLSWCSSLSLSLKLQEGHPANPALRNCPPNNVSLGQPYFLQVMDWPGARWGLSDPVLNARDRMVHGEAVIDAAGMQMPQGKGLSQVDQSSREYSQSQNSENTLSIDTNDDPIERYPIWSQKKLGSNFCFSTY